MIDWSKVDSPEPVLQRFPSRRSVVYGTKGVVSSSQPLATEAGLEILRLGGNAGTSVPFVKSPCNNRALGSGRSCRHLRGAERDGAGFVRDWWVR
jgi:hypothetical protein